MPIYLIGRCISQPDPLSYSQVSARGLSAPNRQPRPAPHRTPGAHFFNFARSSQLTADR
jgi:hypothetical protein